MSRLDRLDRLVTPWAHASPRQIAIDGKDEALTYAELDAMANRFARMFIDNGVNPGDRIGIHLPRSGRAVAAMLGALRASAVFVPLDPGSPPARVQMIVGDCGMRHVVISPSLLASWRAAGVGDAVECFLTGAPDGDDTFAGAGTGRVHGWAELCSKSAAWLEPFAGGPDDLAYMLYTSGSTGVPKGVMLSHRNALTFVEWAAAQINLSPVDRVASVAPFHFDLSVFDIWASLSRGATVVIVDETTVVSGKRMLDRIEEKSISVWYSVPSALVLMLDDGGLDERRASARSLRVVFFAGEVFPIKHLRRAMAAIPQARFFNLFGPTETNVCTAWALPSALADDDTVIPIGRPACWDTCTILDSTGQPVPEGELGELFVDGPTIMLGYWDGGRRTPARRPYPTGDLVSRRPDGALMYHGRRDHLVKIHGYRVELGDVEAALHEHPKIREGIAMAIEQQLVIVAVPSDPSVSVLELKQHCATRLPKYMIPGAVRFVSRLPRTSSGKIDRVRTREEVVEWKRA